MNLFKKVSLTFLSIIGLVSIASCTDKNFDKDAGYRDVTSKLTLSKSYEGKNFIDDGIGLATVSKLTDGDTTNFKLSTKSTIADTSVITVRYHGVNTPESTINVEKWGKTASLYTANRLTNAYEIVLEATSTPAEKDTNNTRYLGYVWYRESANDTFKNLNLELVENGYSKVTSTIAAYNGIFKEAQSFAEKHEMHIWSNDNDPNYSDEPISTTLQAIVTDLESSSPTFYDNDLELGARVEFDAFIDEHTTTSNGSNYYVISMFDETGKKYSLNAYGGYSSSNVNTILNVGYLVHFIGTIQKYNGSYQVSGLEYTISAPESEKVHVLQKDFYQFFDSNHKRLHLSKETAVNGDLTVTSATVSGTVLTIVGQAKETTTSTETKEFILKVNVSENYDASALKDKTIKAKGLKNADGSIQVNFADLIIR